MAHRKQSGLTLSERRLVKRVLILMAIAGLLWLVFAPGWGILHYRRLHDRMETLARENESLEKRNAELKKEIERLKTDDAYLEEIARQKYGMLKENETVYEFKPSDKKK